MSNGTLTVFLMLSFALNAVGWFWAQSVVHATERRLEELEGAMCRVIECLRLDVDTWRDVLRKE